MAQSCCSPPPGGVQLGGSTFASAVTQTAYGTAADGGSVAVGGAVPTGKRRYVVSMTIGNQSGSAIVVCRITDGTSTLAIVQLHQTAHPTLDVCDDPETPILILETGTTLTFFPTGAIGQIRVTFFDEP